MVKNFREIFGLTPKQEKLFRYLEREINRSGKTPSLRQTAAQMGVSHAAISQLLGVLEEKGVLKREGRYSRTIHLLHHARRTGPATPGREVPIIGRIAAGLPLYAQQEWAGHLVVDPAVYRGRHLFALSVKGDSMQGAAILDGDLVVCEPRQYAENGEIVVALVRHEEATIKRFFRRKRHIELRPENPAHRPKHYLFDEILVQGKVIGVHRGPDAFAKYLV